MNYREAIQHARCGGTAYCGNRAVRFLTFAEAQPILLREKPELDEKGNEFANPTFDLKRLGLYDVGGGEPIEFRPTEEDFASTAWRTTEHEPEPAPEPVAPEVVDEVLHEDPLPDAEPAHE